MGNRSRVRQVVKAQEARDRLQTERLQHHRELADQVKIKMSDLVGSDAGLPDLQLMALWTSVEALVDQLAISKLLDRIDYNTSRSHHILAYLERHRVAQEAKPPASEAVPS